MSDTTPTPGLRERFVQKAPTPSQLGVMAAVREEFGTLAVHLDSLTPGSREKSLAMTHLEEAKFWVNQGIMQHGLQPHLEQTTGE